MPFLTVYAGLPVLLLAALAETQPLIRLSLCQLVPATGYETPASELNCWAVEVGLLYTCMLPSGRMNRVTSAPAKPSTDRYIACEGRAAFGSTANSSGPLLGWVSPPVIYTTPLLIAYAGRPRPEAACQPFIRVRLCQVTLAAAAGRTPRWTVCVAARAVCCVVAADAAPAVISSARAGVARTADFTMAGRGLRVPPVVLAAPLQPGSFVDMAMPFAGGGNPTSPRTQE